MPPRPADVSAAADRIEAELRQLGAWQETPLAPEQYEFTQAFGADTMAFVQWLQFIFLPRVREAVQSESFPSTSQVGAYAVRELDGWHEASALVTALCDFDALF